MNLCFYLFSSLLILGSIGVVGSRNPVYSVLWLIFVFCNASALFILLGAEFIAMTLVIVYVGAVAVLFLFVVMMLNINLEEIKSSFTQNLPVALFFLLIFTADIIAIIMIGFKDASHPDIVALSDNILGKFQEGELTNTIAIGSVLYTKYMLQFQVAGIILLVAMIGSIALTLRNFKYVKRQDKSKQLMRNKKEALQLVKVPSNCGVKGIKYE